ncbi:MAG: UDP-3-O-acyl-N-acetylglucosamine deacetylase, partial [Rhodospirillaceae bacterium]|nr:UDP-3-O-acyl-N-acetylglucosamine deacetylase [Rhodospirillaceae bacterium]
EVLNEDGLRFDDEFVRHKILDAVGDLYLAGGTIAGHFSGVCTGHSLNNKLLRALFADEENYEWVDAFELASKANANKAKSDPADGASAWNAKAAVAGPVTA